MLRLIIVALLILVTPSLARTADYTALDARIAAAVQSGQFASALSDANLGSQGAADGIRSRAVFIEALRALAGLKDDPQMISIDQADVLQSVLTALSATAEAERKLGTRNGLERVTEAVWSSFVAPLVKEARKLGLRALGAGKGMPVRRWIDATKPRRISVFELFADNDQRGLNWTISDLDKKTEASKAAYSRFAEGKQASQRPVSLILYLDLSGLGPAAHGLADAAVSERPAKLMVIAGDNAEAVQACVASRASLGAPEGSGPGRAASALAPGASAQTPAGSILDLSPTAAAKSPAGSSAKSERAEPGALPSTAPIPPARDDEADCERDNMPLLGRRSFAVVVDRKRQIEVLARKLADANDVDQVLGLARALSREWP